jgi:hypothetical protein
MAKEIPIVGDFEAFKDTSVYERYMQNAYQFSAARNADVAKEMQAAVFDSEGTVKSFSKFKKDAEQITNIENEVHLRQNYEVCRKSAVMGERWRQIESVKKYYPYWVYRGQMDGRERDEHVALEGKVYRVGDPEGDSVFPPNGWGPCRCDGVSIDGNEIEEQNLKVQTTEEAKADLEENVDKQFRFNPAHQGMLPKEGITNGNIWKADDYGLSKPSAETTPEGLSTRIGLASGLHQIVAIVEGWKHNYKTEDNGDIIFQNKDTFTNIVFNNVSIHNIQKHPRGFEGLPNTLQDADEIWGTWGDEKQKVVLRNYITFGEKVSYIAQTKDGVVVDAFAVSNGSLDKFRKGIIY